MLVYSFTDFFLPLNNNKINEGWNKKKKTLSAGVCVKVSHGQGLLIIFLILPLGWTRDFFTDFQKIMVDMKMVRQMARTTMLKQMLKTVQGRVLRLKKYEIILDLICKAQNNTKCILDLIWGLLTIQYDSVVFWWYAFKIYIYILVAFLVFMCNYVAVKMHKWEGPSIIFSYIQYIHSYSKLIGFSGEKKKH